MNPYLAYISACANLLVDRAREERDGRRKHTKPNDGDGVAAKVAGGSGDGEADGRDRGHGSLSLDHHGRRIRAGDRRRKLGRASCEVGGGASGDMCAHQMCMRRRKSAW